MSGSYVEAHALLCDVLEEVGQGDVRFGVARKPGPLGNPPMVYVPAPELTWDGYVTAPTESVFEVVVAVAADEFAIEKLFLLLPVITTALDTTQAVEATVRSAVPGVWRSNNTDLPCYFVRTEIATS